MCQSKDRGGGAMHSSSQLWPITVTNTKMVSLKANVSQIKLKATVQSITKLWHRCPFNPTVFCTTTLKVTGDFLRVRYETWQQARPFISTYRYTIFVYSLVASWRAKEKLFSFSFRGKEGSSWHSSCTVWLSYYHTLQLHSCMHAIMPACSMSAGLLRKKTILLPAIS